MSTSAIGIVRIVLALAFIGLCLIYGQRLASAGAKRIAGS